MSHEYFSPAIQFFGSPPPRRHRNDNHPYDERGRPDRDLGYDDAIDDGDEVISATTMPFRSIDDELTLA